MKILRNPRVDRRASWNSALRSEAVMAAAGFNPRMTLTDTVRRRVATHGALEWTPASNRRSATAGMDSIPNRGLKPTATFISSRRDERWVRFIESPHFFLRCIGTMKPLTAWSPGFSRSKPFEPPKGGTPNQARIGVNPGKPRLQICRRPILQQFIGLGLIVVTALLPFSTLAQFTGGPPVINGQPQSQIVAAGTDVTFQLGVAQSYTPVRYQWQKFGVDLAGATNSTLVITNAALRDGGNDAVVVANAAGAIPSETANLAVVQASANPPSVSLGASVTLRANTSGSLSRGHHWSFGGLNIPGATNSTLVLTNVQLANAGTYSVAVTTDAGSVTVSTLLQVDPQFTKITDSPIVNA